MSSDGDDGDNARGRDDGDDARRAGASRARADARGTNNHRNHDDGVRNQRRRRSSDDARDGADDETTNARATDGDDERTDARLFPPTRADEEGTKTRTRGDEATRGTNEAKENDDEGRRKANERGKTRGRGGDGGVGATGGSIVDAARESATAGLAVCGNVYVRSVENKLPPGVRSVVKGARCEVRTFADVFFATMFASCALTVRVVGAGAGAARRAGERTMSTAGEASARIAREVKMKTMTIAKGGNDRKEARGEASKASEPSSVASLAKEKTKEALRGLDDAKLAALASVKSFFDDRNKPGGDGTKSKKSGEASGSKSKNAKKKSVDVTKTNGDAKPRRKKSVATEDGKLKRRVDPLRSLVSEETSKKVKEKLKGFEDAVGSWPMVQAVKPRVDGFVEAFAERQRVVVAKLHSSTEGGVDTIRGARASLVHHAKGLKTRVEDGVTGARGILAGGIASTSRLVSPLLRHDRSATQKSRLKTFLNPGSSGRAIMRDDEYSAAQIERHHELSKQVERAAKLSREADGELLAKPLRVVVQPEDNLFDIASIAGISVMDLARYNNLRPHPESHFLKIYPGQVLNVPSRSLLDRLPAIDRAREPKYELSVRVTDVPRAAPPPTASSRLVHPSRHSRHKSVRESDDALESSNFAASLGVSLALCAAALALRSVREAMNSDDEDVNDA
jgi:LysM repeat protein